MAESKRELDAKVKIELANTIANSRGTVKDSRHNVCHVYENFLARLNTASASLHSLHISRGRFDGLAAVARPESGWSLHRERLAKAVAGRRSATLVEGN